MKGVLAFLLCEGVMNAARVTQQQINVTLSLNETALIDPSPYFNYQFSEFNITHSDSPSAQVLPQLEVKEVSEAHTQGTEWRFGASVVTSEFAFFAVLYTHKLEVWRVHRHSLSKEWEADAAVERVVGVSLKDVEGFAYWTHSNLYFIDLQQSTLSAREMRGVDISSASHIAVCSKRDSMTTIQHSLDGYLLTSYSVNYTNMSVEKELSIILHFVEDEILDILCTNHIYYISNQSLYIDFDYMRIPASFGVPLSLEQIGNTNDAYLQASAGVVMEGIKSLLLPGVVRVLSLAERTVLVQKGKSDFAVVIEESDKLSKSHSRRTLPLQLEAADSVLWLEHSAQDTASSLIVQKCSGRMKLLRVSIATPLVKLLGEEQPYALTLCGTDTLHEQTSRCTRVVVSAVPEPPPKLLLSDQDYLFSPANCSLSHSVTLNERRNNYTLIFARSLSGPNIELKNLVFPHLPAHLSYKLSPFRTESTESLSYSLPPVDEKAELLCSGLIAGHLKAVYRLNGKVIESMIDYTITRNVGKAFPLSCVYFQGELIIYVIEESDLGKLVTFSANHHYLTSIELDSGKLLSLTATDSHLILTFPQEVLILGATETQRIAAKAEYQSASVHKGLLILRTASSLEYYAKRTRHYELQGEVVIDENTAKFAMLENALVTLDSGNRLHIYYLSGNYQLIHRFAYRPSCEVLYITDFEYFVLYRCKEYFQLINVSMLRHSHEWKRIPTHFPSSSISHHTIIQGVTELHYYAGEWSVRTVRIDSKKELSVQFEIDIAREYQLSGSITMQGVLEVSSQHSSSVGIAVNLTLENYGAVITTTEEADSVVSSSETLSAVEVPWGEERELQPRDFFQGELMHFSAKSSDPRVTVTTQNAVDIDFTLQGLNSALDIRVALDTQTLFYCSQGSLIARGFTCVGQSCTIVSEHSVSLRSLSIAEVQQLDVLSTIESFTLLRLLGSTHSTWTYQSSSVIISFDSKSSKFELMGSLFPHNIDHQYQIIKRTNTTDIFFYKYALEHCMVTVDSTAKLACSEVNIPRLVQVTSLGSRQVSGTRWELYVLTREEELYTFHLCGELSLLAVSPLHEAIHTPIIEPKIVGSKLIVGHVGYCHVYSLPDFNFLYSVPWILLKGISQSRKHRWNVRESIVHYDSITKYYYLVNLNESSHSLLFASIPLEKFQLTGQNQAAGWTNKTLQFLSFSRGKVVLERDDSQLETVETEVEITARNEMSERRVKLRVVRTAKTRWRWIAAGTVGITCAYLLTCRRKARNQLAEIELQVV